MPSSRRVQPILLKMMFRFALSWLLLTAGCGESHKVGLASVSSTLYARTDTDHTTVWSPRQRLSAKLGESAGLETAFAVDTWTSASIDIRTSATKILVHEVRKEVTAGGYYEFPNATLGGGYRYSAENDYWSNGGVANLSVDMADNNTTLGIATFGSKDLVGRSGDPNFHKKPQDSFGGRLSLTQVIDPKTVLMVSWETTKITGYQASPYRRVAVGGSGTHESLGTRSDVEIVPGERFRSALVLHGRRAVGDRLSLGLEYRFYTDNWGLYSHTVAPDLAWLVSDHGTFRLGYRYYTQSEADFYRPRYRDSSAPLGFRTRDRELSALYSNRVGLSYLHEFELGEQGTTVLTAALRTGVTRFTYLAFVGLTQVDALEGTALLSLDWR
jgi:hypothetical protein